MTDAARTAGADAIVLAGGTIKAPEFREVVGVECRALIPVLGKPMVVWVVEALKGAQHINRVVVLGGRSLYATELPRLADAILEEGVDEVDNLFRGLEALPGAEQVLMVSGDLPLLTPQALNDFIEHAPPGASVVFPVCEQADIERDFPDRDWVFVKTPEGRFTGSSCFLFRPAAVEERREWVQRVFDARRSVWKLIRMWGKRFTIKALLHRVTLADAAARASKILGIPCGVYVSSHTELAMDVDKASDVTLVEARLRRRSA